MRGTLQIYGMSDECTIRHHDTKWNGTNDEDRVCGEEGDQSSGLSFKIFVYLLAFQIRDSSQLYQNSILDLCIALKTEILIYIFNK